jgi:DNA-binding NarL/FixJ family response regulator
MTILAGTECEADPAILALPEGSHPVTRVRTLLVDDSGEFLNSAADFLSGSRDIEIVGRAQSGREAIRLAAELFPDLVLVDISMPEINGIELTRRLKQGASPPKVVILTFHVNAAYRLAAELAGADAFVAKTDLVDTLLPTVLSLFKTE